MTGFDLIKKIETEKPVESIRFKGVQIWPILRRHLENAHNVNCGLSSDKSQFAQKLSLKKFLSVCSYGVRHLLKLFYVDFFLFSASERRKLTNGVYEDRVLEGVVQQLSSNYIVIENPAPAWQHVSATQLRHKQLISESLLLLMTMVLGYLFLPFARFEGLQIIHDLQNEYNLKIRYRSYLRRHVGQYYLYKFFTIFKSPQIAFFVFPGSWFGAIQALKLKKTVIVELQHGLIYKKHLAYNYFKQHDGVLLPDYLLTYGDNERVVLQDSFFLPPDKIKPVGYYFLSAYANRPPCLQNNPFKWSVVFSHQVPVEVAGLEFLKAVAKLNPDILFIICPRALTDVVLNLKAAKIPNIIIGAKSIYEHIADSNLHCTVSSSTAIDALGMNRPSILFDVQNKAQDSIGANFSVYIKLIKKPEQFRQALDLLMEACPAGTVLQNNSFKPNFVENIHAFLHDLNIKTI